MVTVFLFFAVMVTLILGATMVFAAPGISLEQCRNGGAATPNACVSLGGGSGWVGGNAGHTQAHYREGYSVPYRAIATEVPPGNVSVTLGYDIKHSDHHALDFLTHFDRLEPHGQFGHPAEIIEPTSGVSGVGGDVATCAIPKPSNLGTTGAGATFDNLPAGEKLFTVYGASSCSFAANPYVSVGDLTAKQSEAQITVNFVATSPTVVLAWGGHIALSSDWNNKAAAGISGSPYHMRFKAWSASNAGSQDRSLAAKAVVAQPSTVTTTLKLMAGATPAAGDATVPLNSAVPLGSIIYDTANVPGSPTGTVTFTFFTNGDCTGDGAPAGSATLSAGFAGPSQTRGPLAPGSYAFRGRYNGEDPNFTASTSDCEPFTVSKGSPSITTTLHNAGEVVVADGSTVPLGTTMHDRADVTALVTGFTPSAVKFWFFENGTCTGDGVAKGEVAIVSGVAHPSTSVGPLAAGNYSFKATMDANASYDAASSSCEPFTVGKATLGITTTLHDADHNAIADGAEMPIGTVMHDRATVTGIVTGIAPTNQITFRFFENGTCDGSGTAAGSASIDATGVAHPSTATAALGPGQYSFRASYAADANYNAATSPCEPFSVALATPTLATAPWVYPNDSATLSGLVNPSGGSLTFRAYLSESACNANGTPDYQRVFTDVGNSTYETDNTGWSVNTNSTVYWRVHFSGDSNNASATSQCVERITLTFVGDSPAP